MLKGKYKTDYQREMRTAWCEKHMHGKFPKYLDNPHIDVDQSFQWMKHTGLKGETGGLIIAAQDQALKTRYFAKHIKSKATQISVECATSSQKQPSTSWQVV